MIINEIVKTNPNVRMVLSGHYHNAQRVELPIDDDGDGQTDRVVQQLLFDYQSLSEGGMGYIRLMHWDNDSQTVTFRTYSPTLDDYNAKDYPDIKAENIAGEEEFTVSYADLGITPMKKELETDNFTINFDSEEIIGTISNITSDDLQSFTWEDPTIGTFGWYTEVTDEFGGITKSEMRTLTVEEESTEPDDSNPDNPGDNKDNDNQNPGDNQGNDNQNPGDNQGNDNQNPGDNQGNDNQNPGDNQGNDNQKPGDKPNVPGDNGNNQKPGNNQGSNNQKPGNSQNNSNNNTNKPSSNPQTGDDMNVGYVLMAIVLAGGALVFITKLKKSEEK